MPGFFYYLCCGLSQKERRLLNDFATVEIITPGFVKFGLRGTSEPDFIFSALPLRP